MNSPSSSDMSSRSCANHSRRGSPNHHLQGVIDLAQLAVLAAQIKSAMHINSISRGS
jgi:hypothetical protein